MGPKTNLESVMILFTQIIVCDNENQVQRISRCARNRSYLLNSNIIAQATNHNRILLGENRLLIISMYEVQLQKAVHSDSVFKDFLDSAGETVNLFKNLNVFFRNLTFPQTSKNF